MKSTTELKPMAKLFNNLMMTAQEVSMTYALNALFLKKNMMVPLQEDLESTNLEVVTMSTALDQLCQNLLLPIAKFLFSI